jgi:uncharacterized protein (TIGR03067 family)
LKKLAKGDVFLDLLVECVMSSQSECRLLNAFLALVAIVATERPVAAQETLYGSWKVQYFARVSTPAAVAAEEEAVPSSIRGDLEIEMTPTKFVLIRSKAKFDCKLIVNPKDAVSGKLTVTFKHKNGREEVLPGIYRIEGDKLSLCLSLDDDRQPLDFEIKYNEAKILMRLKRK